MSASESIGIGALIAHTPEIKRGSAHVAGTGVLVRSVVRWHQAGLVPEEIAAKYGFLRLEQVHAALAYYYANQAEVEAELERVEAESRQIEAQALSRV